MEEDTEQGARELARLLLQGHLDLRAHREEAALSALDTGGRARLAAGRTRLEKGHRRQLATVAGPVTVARCALRAPGLPNCYPADQVLGLPRERHRLGLRRLVVLEAARGSYDSTLEAIERRCGMPVVGKRQAEQLVRAAAVDIAAFYAARTPAPAAGTTLLVLSVDGKGIVMRPGHLREATRKAAERAPRTFRTRLSAGEKTCRKRMATLAVIHDAAPAPRRPHDIIAPPGGRTTRRTPRKGPKARAKWLTASVEHDADQVIAAAFDQAEARDPQHRRCWVVLVDGAAHQIELIHAQAARRGVTIHVILDIVHVIEKLWAASRCFYTAPDPAAEAWVGTKAARILAGAAHQRRRRHPHTSRPAGPVRRSTGRSRQGLPLPGEQRRLSPLRQGLRGRMANRQRHRRRSSTSSGGRPARYHRQPVERPRSRSRPDPPGPHQQRRLPAVLDLPHPQRTRTPLPPARPAQLRTPGLTGDLTSEEPHPSPFTPARSHGASWRTPS
ncbi:hypothetical protein [Streptomyces sp. NPDC001340]